MVWSSCAPLRGRLIWARPSVSRTWRWVRRPDLRGWCRWANRRGRPCAGLAGHAKRSGHWQDEGQKRTSGTSWTLWTSWAWRIPWRLGLSGVRDLLWAESRRRFKSGGLRCLGVGASMVASQCIRLHTEVNRMVRRPPRKRLPPWGCRFESCHFRCRLYNRGPNRLQPQPT